MAKTPAKPAKGKARATSRAKSRTVGDHDLVKVYLNQMSHIPPISVEEERILAKDLEDTRADLRRALLFSGQSITIALQMLERIAAGNYPADRALLIEANDKSKKILVQDELKRSIRIVRRFVDELRRLFRDLQDERLDARAKAAKLRRKAARKRV